MCKGAQQDPCPARAALRVNLIVAGLFLEFSRGANVRERREMLAGSTGLEPAASGVTGRRSNQLNYDPTQERRDFRFQRVDFRLGCHANRLTIHRRQSAILNQQSEISRLLVGGTGLEPVTAGV